MIPSVHAFTRGYAEHSFCRDTFQHIALALPRTLASCPRNTNSISASMFEGLRCKELEMTVACVSSTCSDGEALSTLQVGEARGWEIASGHLTLPHRRLLYLQQVLLLPFPGASQGPTQDDASDRASPGFGSRWQ
jgi:hypothetical protein